MVNYILLIPNSEGKIEGGDINQVYRFISNLKKYNSFVKLQPQRDLIIDEIRRIIRTYDEQELSVFFDLKGENLKNAISNMTALKDEECMPAINRMSGVMYNAINYDSLDETRKNRFNDSVIILDGLFGLLKPLDLIPNYKCKVSMKLFDSTLAKFWQKELLGYFEYVCKDKLVLDVLPNSHRDIIKNFENLDRIEIIFAKQDGDSFKLEGHASKELKGEFINYVTGFDSISKEDLMKFKHSKGHKFNNKFSNESEFIYIK